MRLLAVGVACLDILLEVDEFPAEDTKTRTRSQRKARGGNASSVLVVASQLGAAATFLGPLVDPASGDPDARALSDELMRYNVDCRGSPLFRGAAVPTSFIIVSKRTSSRTIIHSREIPDLDFPTFVDGMLRDAPTETAEAAREWSASGGDLSCLPPLVLRCVQDRMSELDWIHLEGRWASQTRLMLALLQFARGDACATSPRISLEVEKDREDIDTLWEFADVVIVSREFSVSRYLSTPPEALDWLVARCRAGATLVVPWGAEGAWARTPDGETVHAPAVHPHQGVVDTVGAGDTFVGTLLMSLGTSGHGNAAALSAAVRRACLVAGVKCGQTGFGGLVQAVEEHTKETGDGVG